MTRSLIWVSTFFEGIHRWKDAPNTVFFLRDYHRHIFTVKVYIEVFHNEREIEFIDFKRFINQFEGFKEKADSSCENYSDSLYSYISSKFPNRNTIIEIGEDGENGSRKEYIINE